jgi:uncharacterized membrane protein
MGVDPYDPAFVDVRGLPLELRDAGEKKGWTHPDFVAALSDLRARREGFLHDLDALCVDRGKLRAAVQKRVHPLFGVVLSLALVLWLGWVTGGFVGRQVLDRLESAMLAVPGVRAVYPYSKQLVDFFLTEENRGRIQFKSVALVRYPSERVWTLAFVTNRAPGFMAEAAGVQLVTVFVPSSPIPMTGYTVNVPEDSVVYLPMSVDEALRVVVSGGVLTPAAGELTGVGENRPGSLPGGEPPGGGPLGGAPG